MQELWCSFKIIHHYELWHDSTSLVLLNNHHDSSWWQIITQDLSTRTASAVFHSLWQKLSQPQGSAKAYYLRLGVFYSSLLKVKNKDRKKPVVLKGTGQTPEWKICHLARENVIRLKLTNEHNENRYCCSYSLDCCYCD